MSNGRLKTASLGPGFVAAVLLFCGFAAVAWVLFRFAAPAETYEEKRADARRQKVAAINAEAQEKLYGPPKWIDKTKGTIQLPIDVAMDLVVNDYQAKQVQPSQVKVDNPYPYGLQTFVAAPATAPAGPAVPPGTLPKPGPAGSPAPATPAPASAPPAASPAPAAPASPAPAAPASPAPAAAAGHMIHVVQRIPVRIIFDQTLNGASPAPATPAPASTLPPVAASPSPSPEVKK